MRIKDPTKKDNDFLKSVAELNKLKNSGQSKIVSFIKHGVNKSPIELKKP